MIYKSVLTSLLAVSSWLCSSASNDINNVNVPPKVLADIKLHTPTEELVGHTRAVPVSSNNNLRSHGVTDSMRAHVKVQEEFSKSAAKNSQMGKRLSTMILSRYKSVEKAAATKQKAKLTHADLAHRGLSHSHKADKDNFVVASFANYCGGETKVGDTTISSVAVPPQTYYMHGVIPGVCIELLNDPEARSVLYLVNTKEGGFVELSYSNERCDGTPRHLYDISVITGASQMGYCSYESGVTLNYLDSPPQTSSVQDGVLFTYSPADRCELSHDAYQYGGDNDVYFYGFEYFKSRHCFDGVMYDGIYCNEDGTGSYFVEISSDSECSSIDQADAFSSSQCVPLDWTNPSTDTLFSSYCAPSTPVSCPGGYYCSIYACPGNIVTATWTNDDWEVSCNDNYYSIYLYDPYYYSVGYYSDYSIYGCPSLSYYITDGEESICGYYSVYSSGQTNGQVTLSVSTYYQ